MQSILDTEVLDEELNDLQPLVGPVHTDQRLSQAGRKDMQALVCFAVVQQGKDKDAFASLLSGKTCS